MIDLAEILARIPVDIAAELAEALRERIALAPPPTRRDRLNARDEAIVRISRELFADTRGRKPKAAQIAVQLAVLASSRASREDATGRRKALLDVLALCDGGPPSKYQIANILAGRRTPRKRQSR